LRLLPLAGLLSLGIAAAELALDHKQPATPQDPQAVAAAAPAEQPKLGLHVTSRPKQLEIRWNHDAEAILKASRGEMRITDGGSTEVIGFEPDQLRDGGVEYAPTSREVTIQLGVKSPDGNSTVETIRAIAIP
jgi:hypothetical protein